MNRMIDLELFQAQRPRLFSIAYRMLGSASDAEDVVQDAWVRFDQADTSEVRSPQAFASTIVIRLCLDRLKSARATREEYVGPWLPEPVLTNDRHAPDVMAERSESVTLAFLTLLETLSAEERAVFLLKEAFDYEHADIAGILGTSVANSRQLFHRAKTKIRLRPDLRGTEHAGHGRRSGSEASDDQDSQRAIAVQFAEAFQSGDPAQLTELLAADVHFVADGGGRVPTARRPLAGRTDVLNLLMGLHRTAYANGFAAQATIEIMPVNSEPALIVRLAGELDTVFVLNIAEGTVRGIQVIRNPEKLVYLKRQLAVLPRG